ncbi:hypothetical protein HMPREF3226_00109 [Prevotella corporis]|uniref:Uncharacterized protein n=1 Tax=Prevotella corporis TaxID=28128 RepID=A0A133QQH0_9BACT|nr:hypothetical protein HMPREF3226_00109 [Prevotella corporis]
MFHVRRTRISADIELKLLLLSKLLQLASIGISHQRTARASPKTRNQIDRHKSLVFKTLENAK